MGFGLQVISYICFVRVRVRVRVKVRVRVRASVRVGASLGECLLPHR